MTDEVKKTLTLPKQEIEKNNADLEKQAAAAALDQLIPDPAPIVAEPPPEVAAPLVSSATETLEGMLSLLPIGLSVTGLKNTASVFSAETCKTLAERTIPVLKKYVLGQKIIKFLETGSGIEEIALATALVPVGLAVYRGYGLDVEAAKAVTDTEKKTDEPLKFTNAAGVQ